MNKKLRRRLKDLTARMDARERAAINLLVSLETTDADVRALADMQEAFKSISKTHTMWLVRLSQRVAALEDADRTQKESDPHTQELIDFGLWLSEELTGTPISRADLESCLSDWKASR